MATQVKPRPSFSFVSIAALLCAVFSFFSNGPIALLLAVGAIFAGVIGVLLAFLPSTRGGFISILSIFAGIAGIIAAIIKLASPQM